MRIALGGPGRNPHHFQKLGHAVLPLLPASNLDGAQSLLNGLPHGHPGIEGAEGILKDNLHPPTVGLHLRPRKLGDILTLE